MKTVAVILARGGSKGIPKKNIQMIGGLPLVTHTINCAKWSDIDEVWVSTDSSYVKTIAQNAGAKVLDRPEKFSGDKSPSEHALLHFEENVDFDRLVFIQPTSPLLNPSYVNEGLRKLKEENYDSVFSVYKEHWLPRWTTKIQPLNFENNKRPRRQDRSDVYVENGAFYITTRDALLKSKTRVSGNIGVVEMSPYESFQIDTWEDFNFVEKLL
mgnify:CR=1 FL=1